MSVAASTWVWDHSTAHANTLLVLLSIAEAANSEGRESCQSVATLARHARCSESAAHRALRWLREAGEIEVTGSSERYKGTTIYSLPKMAQQGDRGVTSGTPVKMTPLSVDPPEGVSLAAPEPRTKPTTKDDSQVTSADTEGTVVPGRPLPPPLTWQPAEEPEQHPQRPITNSWVPRQEFAYDLALRFPDLDLAQQVLRFRDFHIERKDVSRSWEAGLRRWCDNSNQRVQKDKADQAGSVFDDLGIRRDLDPDVRAANIQAIKERDERNAGFAAKPEESE